MIFGAGGDLTKRLLMPALYNLAVDGLLDDGMKIIGVNHGERETSAWRDDLHKSLEQFAADKASTFHAGKLDDKAWDWVAQRLEYMAGEFETDDTFTKLKQKLEQIAGRQRDFLPRGQLALLQADRRASRQSGFAERRRGRQAASAAS